MSWPEDLQRLLQPLMRKVDGMVSRVVLRQVDDGHGRQEVQAEGVEGELHPVVEHFQPFGVRGFPPAGVDGLAFAIGGYRNHLAVLGFAPKMTPSPALTEGDVLFHCLNPSVFTMLHNAGSWTAQGKTQWFATLDGLSEYQYVSMTVGRTVIRVEDKTTGRFSQITITPDEVKIETPSFVHP